MSERLESKRCIKALYKYSSFPFFPFLRRLDSPAFGSCHSAPRGGGHCSQICSSKTVPGWGLRMYCIHQRLYCFIDQLHCALYMFDLSVEIRCIWKYWNTWATDYLDECHTRQRSSALRLYFMHCTYDMPVYRLQPLCNVSRSLKKCVQKITEG